MESIWYKINVCVSCEKQIQNHHRAYNDGICPHCGHISDSTICNTKPVILKCRITFKWYSFWNRKVEYFGKDNFSQAYIIKNNLNK